jgi:hypothetical protein
MMEKRLEDMSRQELINLYTGELGGSMLDFDGYANMSMLREAISSIQELQEAHTVALASEFEFIDDEEDDEAPSVLAPANVVESARSDQWYLSHGLPIPLGDD